MTRAGSIVLLSALASCLHQAPATQTVKWDAGCGGTEKGNACLVLRFTATPDMRKNAAPNLAGPLHWAVYKGGDVGLLGPGNNKEIYSGEISSVDLSQNAVAYDVYIPDVAPESYQALAYVDHGEKGHSGSGDPVTFPSGSFGIPKDAETQVDVVLDYLR
jgi:hypothetical protein